MKAKANRGIAEFVNLLSASATVTVFGPSVDRVDPADVAGPRILIGRAALSVPAKPGATWFLPGDWPQQDPAGFEQYMRRVRSGRAGVLAVVATMAGITGVNIVSFDAARESDDHATSRFDAADAGQLAGERPLVTAAHLAWLLGAEGLVCIAPGRDHDQVGPAEALFARLTQPAATVPGPVDNVPFADEPTEG